MKNKCCIEGCNKIIHVKKHMLCAVHYLRYLRTGEVGSAKIRKRRDLPVFKTKVATTTE